MLFIINVNSYKGVLRASPYPVFVVDSNAELSKTAHAPTGNEVEDIAIWHPSSPSCIV